MKNLTLKTAQHLLDERLAAGARSKQHVLDIVAKTVIHDRLVTPTQMKFVSEEGHPGVRLRYTTPGSFTTVDIHRHAFGQLCQKAGLPVVFANALNTPPKQTRLGTNDLWRQDLLAHNLNELFHQQDWADRAGPARFLHRLVAGELRGFLSRRFNRHLASAPLLAAYGDACTQAHAKPSHAAVSPVRAHVQYLYPTVFEVFAGEYVCIGSEWSNSDFGAGRLSVSQTVWRVGTNTTSILDETIGRIHIGSVIQDDELEISEDTAQKEVLTQQGAIRDAVFAQFSEKNTGRLLRALEAATSESIPWSKLKSQLTRFLNKGDIEWLQDAIDTGESIIDLPPINSDPTAPRTLPSLYWASAAVSAIAAKTEDVDRASDLQREAGKLLAQAFKGGE